MWQSLRRLITTLVPSGWSVENILQISNIFSLKKNIENDGVISRPGYF